jgi:hypothetical protein
MPEQPDPPLQELLSRHQLELDRMKDALALLGVAPCSCCKRFFRRTDPAALFDAGEPVCYSCIHEWWPYRCPQLSAEDREVEEGKLVFWLRQYHHAETFKDPAKLPDSSLQDLCIVANCLECHGTGMLMEQERCRHCEGRGTVWIIVPRKQA